MTTFDVIVNYDAEKAISLYKFLKRYGCTGLSNSNLEAFIQGAKTVSYAYRIKTYSNNRYEYCYCLSKYEIMAPVDVTEFMERTVKI